MRTEVQNRVRMTKESVTAELPATDPARRRWMMISEVADGTVLLLEFEHLATLDTDGYFAPEDILDRRKTYFVSLAEVLDHLKRQGVDTDLFDAPWKMDYPL